jgi:hypothetical protein
METKTHSVSVRLRRTKVEYAFVSVPVTGNVIEQDAEDAARLRMSGDRIFELAKSMGSDPSVLWAEESEPLIEIHPLQTAPPRA